MAKQNNNPPASKKQDGAKKKLERETAIVELVNLSDKEITKMTEEEKVRLLIIIGQLLGIVDEKGRVI